MEGLDRGEGESCVQEGADEAPGGLLLLEINDN